MTSEPRANGSGIAVDLSHITTFDLLSCPPPIEERLQRMGSGRGISIEAFNTLFSQCQRCRNLVTTPNNHLCGLGYAGMLEVEDNESYCLFRMKGDRRGEESGVNEKLFMALFKQCLSCSHIVVKGKMSAHRLRYCGSWA